MNILAEELAKWFEEVPAMEFYREVFPEGELDGADELTPGRYTGDCCGDYQRETER